MSTTDDGLRVSATVTIDPRELRWRFSRSRGPGGQGVNTTDSRVELSLDVGSTTALSEVQRARACAALEARLVDGVLTVAASEHRSQHQNRHAAMDRLAELLRAAIAPPAPPRRATRPSRGAVRRRAEAKRRHSETKRLRRRPAD